MNVSAHRLPPSFGGGITLRWFRDFGDFAPLVLPMPHPKIIGITFTAHRLVFVLQWRPHREH